MAVSKRLRYEVLRRDGHACRYCGAKAPAVELTVDHVTPRALGGTDEPPNLVACCRPCNSGKTSVSPSDELVADVDEEAIAWARRVKAALAEMAGERRAVADDIAAFGEWWRGFGEPIGMADLLSDDWHTSIKKFLDEGLTLSDLTWFAEDAMLNPRVRRDGVWRYFCGICWSTLKEAQQRAAGQP